MAKGIYVGDSLIHSMDREVEMENIQKNGEDFYKISHVDQMEPFFMTIVSPSDHWMFISSNGGLSAGRKNSESSLFPYYSDDKITASAEQVGSKTLLKVDQDGKTFLWEPFSTRTRGHYRVTRNLYKNRVGNKIIFEEINEDLSVQFSYCWQFSEAYGFVKKSELANLSDQDLEVEVLDGLQNIIPYGVGTAIQNFSSNLVNGYRRSILDTDHNIGVFTLSAMIVDRAEPSEALRATTVWCSLESKSVLLSVNQLDRFRKGETLESEEDVKGTVGAYFTGAVMPLQARESKNWYTVAEVNQDRPALSNLKTEISSGGLIDSLEEDLDNTSDKLTKLIASADGLQLTNDTLSTGRHLSNVLFNIMRGGIFEDAYDVDVDDFLNYVNTINKGVHDNFYSFYPSGDTVSYQELISKALEIGDNDLIRISYEYLPLTFSRRHGDPSRPWNRFTIDLKYPNGTKKRSYEGNWRDIFQNWEALAYSYPDYTLGMIFKFLNATTIDGYNPYRITREGIDWEVVEPDDPWSYIGYWGDHQIIYLQKLLECAHGHDANTIAAYFSSKVFVYANVPYDIASYEEIVSNPQDTITFNQEKEEEIHEMVTRVGADGKMVTVNNRLVKASMMEKLLVLLLAKLTNLVPEGGIWLNTQRPEWNDANNALVGNGLSMVTLYYMRRFCQFLSNMLSEHKEEDYEVHEEVGDLFLSIRSTLELYNGKLNAPFTDGDRKSFVDRVGKAGESYRTKAYEGFNGRSTLLSGSDIEKLLTLTIQTIDHSIEANKREDGLYHAYNLLTFVEEDLEVDHLYEMLEGQVAVLSSGVLSGAESLDVLDALKASRMFREDQYSYFLYPNRDIAHFLNKNEVPSTFAEKSGLLQKLKAAGNTHLVSFDSKGACYFNGDIHNAEDVRARLKDLNEFSDLVEAESEAVLGVFEEMFDHKSFTGRSGTFFAFEGLGSIYWHMVSKLLLAVQETIYRTSDEVNAEEKGRLVQHYYEIRAGIGINKSPSLYGAFPTDAYSHTPLHRGAQQPGMTGQVKEDVLNRWAELGIRVHNGVLSFAPGFLNTEEFLREPDAFNYVDAKGHESSLNVLAGQLAFTYCQVPVVYIRSDQQRITIFGESLIDRRGNELTLEESLQVFQRSGYIQRIDVYVTV